MNWEEGQTLAILVKPTITREQLREYANASGDLNPIHLDDSFAKAAGFPSVIVHGMISMAFMGDHLRRHFSEDAFQLVRFRCRFKRVTFPGDTLTCEGVVKKILPDSSLQLGLTTRNQNGEITSEGDALLLPR